VRRSLKYGLYAAVLAGVVGSTAAWVGLDKTVTVQVDGQARQVHTVADDVSGTLTAAGLDIGAHDLVAPAATSRIHNGGRIVLKRGRLLHLTIDGQRRDLWVTDSTVSQAMLDLGFPTATFTSVSRDKRLPLTPTDIAVIAPKTVTVVANGNSQTVSTTDPTVADLLADLGISYSSDDSISPSIQSSLTDGATVTVSQVTTGQVTSVQALPYQTTQESDATLAKGATAVVKAGKAGTQQITYAVVYIDGVPTGQTVLSTTVLTPPTTQVVKVGTKAAAPATTAPIVVDPGSAQAIAQQMLLARGWGNDQLSCLIQMWNHESGWRVNAANASGAYGIPQALPGSKMAAYGSDWQTNPATQIAWGLAYISGRYSTPCGAWSSWQVNGWY
jgi:resuscitation-promoting factor RpfB